MIHPLIGPIIKEVNKEVLTDNEYFIFDVANFVFGLVNFSYWFYLIILWFLLCSRAMVSYVDRGHKMLFWSVYAHT